MKTKKQIESTFSYIDLTSPIIDINGGHHNIVCNASIEIWGDEVDSAGTEITKIYFEDSPELFPVDQCFETIYDLPAYLFSEAARNQFQRMIEDAAFDRLCEDGYFVQKNINDKLYHREED